MALQTSLDILTKIVEQYESDGKSVRQLEVFPSGDSRDTLYVTMDVPVTLCTGDRSLNPELSPKRATLSDGSRLQVEFSTSVLTTLSPSIEKAVSVANREVSVTDDGTIHLTVELTIDPSGSKRTLSKRKGTSSVADPVVEDETERSVSIDEPTDEPTDENALATVRDNSIPLYEDTPYLEQLYETYDTFAEMSQRVEMDISSETVRRYMIESGIHEPMSYRTQRSDTVEERLSAATENTTEAVKDTPRQSNPTDSLSVEAIAEEQLFNDGIELPQGVRIAEIVDAVTDSVTVYEVQRHLGLERKQTQELLKELDLLDLVLHRVADGPTERLSQDEVVTRIRHCVPSSG